jgi:hypothetical protein
MGYKDPEVRKAYHRKWSKEHSQRLRDKNQVYRDADKTFVFNALGGKCVRCGFDDWRALQVDHIKGKPENLPRTDYKRGGKGLYNAIRRGLFPLSDFQLLCANHNWIKRWENGEHTKRKKENQNAQSR